MPNSVTTRAGRTVYGNPFVGPVNHTVAIRLDVSDLTAVEIDADGYLKPGVLLKEDGTIIDATAGEFAYGAVVEAVKVAASNVAADIAAATDIDVTVAVIALLNRDILEDILGRALSAAELAAIRAAGSRLAITPT